MGNFLGYINSSIHSNPTLSSVDKFNYLMSLVNAEAIAGLTITSANYDEANCYSEEEVWESPADREPTHGGITWCYGRPLTPRHQGPTQAT